MEKKKMPIGCDEAAYELKEVLKAYLEDKGYEVLDYGVQEGEKILYPDVAFKVAEDVAKEGYDRGILLCGTGLGVCMSANKVRGVRAAVIHDPYSAERSRKSNNAQIAWFGARIIGAELAKNLLDIWLDSEFQGGRSLPKVDRMIAYDKTQK